MMFVNNVVNVCLVINMICVMLEYVGINSAKVMMMSCL